MLRNVELQWKENRLPTSLPGDRPQHVRAGIDTGDWRGMQEGFVGKKD